VFLAALEDNPPVAILLTNSQWPQPHGFDAGWPQVSSARRPNIGTTWSIFERCATFVRERAHYSILNRWYGFIVASVMQIIGCKLVPHGLG
jgi:hypothetical protein